MSSYFISSARIVHGEGSSVLAFFYLAHGLIKSDEECIDLPLMFGTGM